MVTTELTKLGGTAEKPLSNSPYVRNGCITDMGKHVAWLKATAEKPLSYSPYVRNGCITDIDKHVAWLEATGWEYLTSDDPDSDECLYVLKHPEKVIQSSAEHFLLYMSIVGHFDPPTLGYVYILTSPSFTGVWKVGRTLRTPEIRCKQINQSQTEQGDWRVVYALKTWHYAKIEREVKRKFQNKLKYRREYFECDISEVIHFIADLEKTLPVWRCRRGCKSTCKATPKNGVALCNSLRKESYKDRKDLTTADESLSYGGFQ